MRVERVEGDGLGHLAQTGKLEEFYGDFGRLLPHRPTTLCNRTMREEWKTARNGGSCPDCPECKNELEKLVALAALEELKSAARRAVSILDGIGTYIAHEVRHYRTEHAKELLETALAKCEQTEGQS